ncbi:MAG: LamG-like jellyroll fold domain-containing protein, partial [Bacteroidia bacterium]
MNTSIKMLVIGTMALFAVQAAKAQQNALNFVNANSTYVSVPTNSGIPIGNSNYTIEAWFNANSMGTFGIVGWGNYGSGNQVNALRLDASGELINYWWGNDLIVPVGDISGAWHYVAVTWDGTTRSMYLDGNLIGNDNPGANGVPSASNLAVGVTDPALDEYFDGSIDEVRIWSVARTQYQVQNDMSHELSCNSDNGLALYYTFNEGVAGGTNTSITTLTDFSGNGNTGILNNFALTGSTSNFVTGAPVASTCMPAQALNYTGVESAIAPIFSTVSDTLTMEARVNWSGATSANQMIVSNGNTGNAGYAVFVDNSNSNKLSVVLGGVVIMQSTASLTPGMWQMVTVVNNNNNWTLYLDSTAYTLTSNTSSANAITNPATDAFSVGSDQVGTENFNGSIDEVRFWSRALCLSEIENDQVNQLNGNDTALLAVYYFNEGNAGTNNSLFTTVADSSANGNPALQLSSFALNGSTSNFVAPGGTLSGYTIPYNPGIPTIVSSGNLVLCGADSVILTANAAGTYQWSGSSSATTQFITVKTSGIFQVSVTGCYGTASSAPVQVVAGKPMVTVSYNVISGDSICSGLTDTLVSSATGNGPFSYNWSDGTVDSADLVSPTVTTSYTLVVADTNGCTDTVSNINVNVKTTPSVSLTGNPGGNICIGQNDTIAEIASGTGPLTYLWSTGSTNDTITVQPTVTTTYSVLVTDPDGCNIVDEGTVTVNSLPVITVTGHDTINVGAMDTLIASGSSISYAWSAGTSPVISGSSDSVVIAPSATTTYTVTGTDSIGCSDTASFTVVVGEFTAIKNINSSDNTSLYPNPARDNMYLA